MTNRRKLMLVLGVLIVIGGSYWVSRSKEPMGLGAAVKHLWTCSMHPQVIQEQPGRCPICHMELSPLKVDSGAHAAQPHHDESIEGIEKIPHTGRQPMSDMGSGEKKIKYWWDPMMNPPYISKSPGKSPMGMDLVPVYEDEAVTGAEVTIDPAVVQNMGVRTARVTSGALHRSVRAFGTLAEAQPNIREINLRVSGWIRKLYANTEGMHIKEGSPLFDLYSPDLQVAVQELITAKHSLGHVGNESGSDQSPSNVLYQTAVKKLLKLGLGANEVERLSKLDQAPEAVTFTSPISGHLTEKLVVEGSAVKAGEKILELVNHTTLWAEVQVFEKQLPLILVGQKTELQLDAYPGRACEASVIFIHPHVDMITRTALVRLAVPNESLDLRPGMYLRATVHGILSESGTLVPREAVIDTGTRQIVFIANAEGHFEPRTVVMGEEGDDGMVQILSGLAVDEEVVTSGQFLLDSESRLKEAVQKFLSEKQAGEKRTQMTGEAND